MTSDLGFNAQVYGLGSGLFFVGYSLSMIPAQLILLRVGTPRALAFIVTAWGATAMLFSCIAGKTQFYVLRLMLGAFESGAFPAIWWVVAVWLGSSRHFCMSMQAAVDKLTAAAAPASLPTAHKTDRPTPPQPTPGSTSTPSTRRATSSYPTP
jgi:hypothetical protein